MVKTKKTNNQNRKYGYDIDKMDIKEIAQQLESSIEMVDSDSKLKHYFINLRLAGKEIFELMKSDNHRRGYQKKSLSGFINQP